MAAPAAADGPDAFYARLAPFSDPRDVCNLSHYAEVPAGWTVIVTDVRGSTAAIEAGRYREVNLIGAATITAARNAVPDLELAYVFGGDGATLLVPSARLAPVRAALLGLRQVGIERFGLELRVGGVSTDELRTRGGSVLVAKLEVTPGLALAMFAGGGLAEAEALVKGDPGYLWKDDAAPAPDLEGLECRWRPIASERGEIVSVLIRAVAGGGVGPEAAATYARVIGEIGGIVGAHAELNPARSKHMAVSTAPPRKELLLKRPAGASLWWRIKRFLIAWIETWVGRRYMERRVVTDANDWGAYRDSIPRHSDYWKYDDTLRFVIDVTVEQKAALLACFDRFEQAGEIVYGVHAAPEALMTCVAFDRKADHVHFIDGGDGGYARAAKQLKKKIKGSDGSVG
jgi:hypothetical protein